MSRSESGFHRRLKSSMRARRPLPQRHPRDSMSGRTSLTIVLAAGEGTRMRSSTPKVLHVVAGQSLLAHVLSAAPKGQGTSLAVVIGPDHEAVGVEARRYRPDAETFVQRDRQGTA